MKKFKNEYIININMAQKSINSQTISKIFQSRKIILDLAKKRGFDTSDYDSFSINEILIMYTNKQLDIFLTNPTTGKKIYYKYHLVLKYKQDMFLII